jgi:hypothetical protein
MWGIADLLNSVANEEEPYQDIGLDLQGAFESAKVALEKWTDEMISNDIYFAAHVLDPRVKFTLIREQYGDKAQEIINRVMAYFKQQYP